MGIEPQIQINVGARQGSDGWTAPQLSGWTPPVGEVLGACPPGPF